MVALNSTNIDPVLLTWCCLVGSASKDEPAPRKWDSLFLAKGPRARPGREGPGRATQAHPSGLLSCDRAKLWTDGGLGASTAAMLEPYADSDSRGMMQMSCEEIDQERSRSRT